MIFPGLNSSWPASYHLFSGNILVFDNGRSVHAGESIVIEIEPTTKKVVWNYEAGKEFFSEARGSVQRLPNGNTLISEDKNGRCFEVTPEKEIVWQYEESHEINRCQRYPLNWVGYVFGHTSLPCALFGLVLVSPNGK